MKNVAWFIKVKCYTHKALDIYIYTLTIDKFKFYDNDKVSFLIPLINPLCFIARIVQSHYKIMKGIRL